MLLDKWKQSSQSGFSLIEVSIVTAIVLLLAIIAIPAVGAYVVENKVPKVGEELARFVLQAQINAQPGAGAPYSSIGTGNLANMVAESSIFSVESSGGAPTIYHGLGSGGTVVVNNELSGAKFSLTLNKVSQAACPSLASVLQKISEKITITSGESSAVTVKDIGTDYNALTAEAQCSKGDVNTFVFTIA